MNRYWKLLSWELNRFSLFFMVLMLVTLFSQLIGVLLYAHSFMNRANSAMYNESITLAQFAENNGKVSFVNYSSSSLWFIAPVSLCAAVLILLVFFIWYREWFSKNSFIHRLLMLPTARMSIYTAKFSAIMLFVLGLVVFQLLILPLESLLFNAMIKSELRDSFSVVSMITMQPYLKMLIPRHFIEFVLYYSAGLMAIIVVFTAILLERSFRIKGIVAGVAYIIAAGFLFVAPSLITQLAFPNYFYNYEVFLMELLVGIMILIGSLWFSSFLINKKISV